MQNFEHLQDAQSFIKGLKSPYFEDNNYEFIWIEESPGNQHPYAVKGRKFDSELIDILISKSGGLLPEEAQQAVDRDIFYFGNQPIGLLDANPTPVDFRLSIDHKTGSSHVFYKETEKEGGIDKEYFYFLTSGHSLRNTEVGMEISMSVFGAGKSWQGTVYKIFKSDSSIPDVGIVKVDPMHFSEFTEVKVNVAKPVLGTEVGHVPSLYNEGDNGKEIQSKIKLVNVHLAERKMVNENETRVSTTIDDLFAIDDIANAGNSGSAIFSKDFTDVYGLIIQDNEQFNFVNTLGTYVDELTNQEVQIASDQTGQSEFDIFRHQNRQRNTKFRYKPIEYYVQEGKIQRRYDDFAEIQLKPRSKFTVLLHKDYSQEGFAAKVKELYTLENALNHPQWTEDYTADQINELLNQLIASDHWKKKIKDFTPFEDLKNSKKNLSLFMLPSDIFGLHEPRLLAVNCTEGRMKISLTSATRNIVNRPCGTGTDLPPCGIGAFFVLNDYNVLEIWETTPGVIIAKCDKVIGEPATRIPGAGDPACYGRLNIRRYKRHDNQAAWIVDSSMTKLVLPHHTH